MRYGIDVSEWQGRIDWPKVAAAGIDFAVIRAGYGISHPDPTFTDNWRGAAAAGLTRFAYLWCKPGQPPEAQAAYLAGAAPDAAGWWADFEQTDGNPKALGWLALFLATLADRTGRPDTINIYTGPSFWRGLGPASADPSWTRWPLAIAHYTTGAPDVPAPWHDWTFWQHTSAGQVPGIAGRVDLDYLATVGAITAPGADPKGHPFMHLNAPCVAVVPTQTGKGYWEVAADGGIFAFGDAPSVAALIDQGAGPVPLPSVHLNAPVVSASACPAGGLWLVAGDGGIFPAGGAPMFGSIPGLP